MRDRVTEMVVWKEAWINDTWESEVEDNETRGSSRTDTQSPGGARGISERSKRPTRTKSRGDMRVHAFSVEKKKGKRDHMNVRYEPGDLIEMGMDISDQSSLHWAYGEFVLFVGRGGGAIPSFFSFSCKSIYMS